MSTTKTFIRGKIEEDERFFLVAQRPLESKKWNSEIINYFSTRKGKYICFSSYKDSKEPLYFTGRLRNGNLYLYLNGILKTPQPLQVTLTRNIDNNTIYAGMWYKITLGEKYKHSPVTWIFLSSLINNMQKNNHLYGSYETGYLTNSDSKTGSYPDQDVHYMFVPEFFRDESGKKQKSFDVFLKKFAERNTVRGFTINSTNKDWYEYPRWQDSKPLAGPRKGFGVVERSQKSNIGSFSDLVKKEEPRTTESTIIKVPYGTRGSNPPNEPPSDYTFIVGFIFGVISVIIVLVFGYAIYLQFKKHNEDSRKQKIVSY